MHHAEFTLQCFVCSTLSIYPHSGCFITAARTCVAFHPISVENAAMPAVTRQLQFTMSSVFATSARIHPSSRIRRVWTRPLNDSSSTFLTDVWLVSVGDRICLLHLSIMDDGLVVAPPTDADVTGSTFVLIGMLNGSLAAGNGLKHSFNAELLFWKQTVLIKKQTSKKPDLSGNTITETRSLTQLLCTCTHITSRHLQCFYSLQDTLTSDVWVVLHHVLVKVLKQPEDNSTESKHKTQHLQPSPHCPHLLTPL